MVARFCAEVRGALLIIRSWYTDGALRLVRGPVKVVRATVQCGQSRHCPCSEPRFRRLMGLPWTNERPRRRGPSPSRLPCNGSRQSQGSRIHRFRPRRTGGRCARSHQRGTTKMEQIDRARNSVHRVKVIRSRCADSPSNVFNPVCPRYRGFVDNARGLGLSARIRGTEGPPQR